MLPCILYSYSVHGTSTCRCSYLLYLLSMTRSQFKINSWPNIAPNEPKTSNSSCFHLLCLESPDHRSNTKTSLCLQQVSRKYRAISLSSANPCLSKKLFCTSFTCETKRERAEKPKTKIKGVPLLVQNVFYSETLLYPPLVATPQEQSAERRTRVGV